MHSAQGLQCTAGTVEHQTDCDTTRYASGEPTWTIARHEQAKRTIGKALAMMDEVHVPLEPLITGTQRRKDIRITGSAASGLSSADIDITPSPWRHRLPKLPRYPWQPSRVTLWLKERPKWSRNT
jgi:hypothetical protein